MWEVCNMPILIWIAEQLGLMALKRWLAGRTQRTSKEANNDESKIVRLSDIAVDSELREKYTRPD
jgi:hypothetical protein